MDTAQALATLPNAVTAHLALTHAVQIDGNKTVLVHGATGGLLAVPKRSGGRVWRIARHFDTKVLRQVSEANAGPSVVLVFRAAGAGRTTVSLALTKGDTSAEALESRRFNVRVE